MSPIWRVLGASTVGSSHKRVGRGCDDAHAYRVYNDEVVLLAAADGAGSAPHSALGAATAVRVALEVAVQWLQQRSEPAQPEAWRDFLRSVLTSVHHALIALTYPQEVSNPINDGSATVAKPPIVASARDLATTLLFAIVTPGWLAVTQIGDGAIVIQRADGTMDSVTPDRKWEYLDITDFITGDGYLEQAILSVRPRADVQGVALLTDGLQMLALHYPDNRPNQKFFAPLFKYAARDDANQGELERFLHSERVSARTDDDTTLVLAVYQ
jgi:hypothetical protein